MAMPRGEWDRTKTKEQRAADRAKAVKAHKKPGPKKGFKKLKQHALVVADKHECGGCMGMAPADLFTLERLTQNVGLLANVYCELMDKSVEAAHPVLVELNETLTLVKNERNKLFPGKVKVSHLEAEELVKDEAEELVATKYFTPAVAKDMEKPAGSH
jgi:hypothetical protein